MLIQFVQFLFTISSLASITGLLLCFIEPNWSNFILTFACTMIALVMNQSWNKILEEKAEEAEKNYQSFRAQNLKRIMEQTNNYLDNN